MLKVTGTNTLSELSFFSLLSLLVGGVLSERNVGSEIPFRKAEKRSKKVGEVERTGIGPAAEPRLDLAAPEITSLLEAFPCYVLLLDDQHRILYANSMVSTALGVVPKDIIDTFCPMTIHGSNKPWYACPMEEAVQKGQPVEREAFDEQTRRWLKSVVYPVKGVTRDGRKVFLHLVNDITEMKHAERIKDEFIGMVSHELKTPLTIIIGALRTATSQGIAAAESGKLIQDAIYSADILCDIVDNLLELARSQNSSLELYTGKTDITEIAGSVARKLSERSAKHRINIDMPAGLPEVTADPAKVRRILSNLVENAVKYSPQGGEIRVHACHEDNALKIRVSDQGPGIFLDDQEKLFRSFEQLKTTDRSAMQGIGLGLKVCRTLVEAHGGRIWVESEPGRGATFCFTLPLQPAR